MDVTLYDMLQTVSAAVGALAFAGAFGLIGLAAWKHFCSVPSQKKDQYRIE